MHEILHFLKTLTRPEGLAGLAQSMGSSLYVVLFLIVFAETGLVVTPFLPGDSLLFTVGAVCATGGIKIAVVIPLLIVAAVIGDAVNYAVGLRVGPAVFKSERSRLFNKAHLLRTQEFYDRYGGKTIIMARFVPIVRTFAPFVAGIGRMGYAKFLAYNVIGAVAWVLVCVLAGWWFGNLEVVRKHFELVLIAIIGISVLPMVIEFVRARRAPPAA
ncbi:MAG: DedA family protein [Polyangiales bacterium]